MHVSPRRMDASDAANSVDALMTECPLSDRLVHDAAAERRALVAGLLSMPASIAPKYFYDALGCALFAAICDCRSTTRRARSGNIRTLPRRDRRATGTGKQFVDLGAGDCRKAAVLAAVPRAVALRRGRHRARRARPRAVAACRPASAYRHARRRRRFHARARPLARSRRRRDDVLLSRLVDRQFRPGRGRAIPARDSPPLRRRGRERTADRRRHEEGSRTARRGLRRRRRRHRGVQPQRARERQPLSERDFDPAAFAHRGVLQRGGARIEMHLEARTRKRSSSTASRERSPRASASTPRIRTSTRRRNSPRCSSAPAFATCAAGRTTPATSPSSTPRDRGRAARRRIASARPAERNCDTCARMARRRRARAAAQHVLVAHELAVVFADRAGARAKAGVRRVARRRPFPDVAVLQRRLAAIASPSCARMQRAALVEFARRTRAAIASHSNSVGSRAPAQRAYASASKKLTCATGACGSMSATPCSVNVRQRAAVALPVERRRPSRARRPRPSRATATAPGADSRRRR